MGLEYSMIKKNPPKLSENLLTNGLIGKSKRNNIGFGETSELPKEAKNFMFPM